MTTPVKTSNLWLATYWLGAGLRLIEASGVEDPGRVTFCFDDPDQREPALTAEFFGSETIIRTLRARADIGHALYIASHAATRRCSGDELEARLGRLPGGARRNRGAP